VDLLEDEFDYVRAAAVHTVARLAQRRPGVRDLAVDVVTACLTDDGAAVRAAALAALRAAAAAGPLPAAAAKAARLALDDGDVSVRMAAVSCAPSESLLTCTVADWSCLACASYKSACAHNATVIQCGRLAHDSTLEWTEALSTCSAVGATTCTSAEQLGAALHRLISLCSLAKWPSASAACPGAKPHETAADPRTHQSPQSKHDPLARSGSVAAGRPSPRQQLMQQPPHVAGAAKPAAGAAKRSRDVACSSHNASISPPLQMQHSVPSINPTHGPGHASAAMPVTAQHPTVAQRGAYTTAAPGSSARSQSASLSACTCCMRVLLVLQRLSRRHAAFVSDLLPRMLVSQHGFTWPRLSTLVRILGSRPEQAESRAAYDPGKASSQGLLAGRLKLWRPHALRQHAASAWEQEQHATVDLCSAAQHGSASGVQYDDDVFQALGMMVVVMNAAHELPPLLRQVPRLWREMYGPVARRCCLSAWPVRRALPPASLAHVGSSCETWVHEIALDAIAEATK
jgi:hypothetical protein